ncbi:MAG: glycosyltransferase [Paludibacteraceae bacterium]|nr:glycosyltransferase [Paludibacteraceae bacterium]
MKLSIIIPVYNVEQYLQCCVRSVITQTYQDLQVILVDDGSTDSSGILCDQLAHQDSRIQVVHKENGGLSDARNAGLCVATGEYVAFLDSDDVYLHSDGLAQLMALTPAEQPDVILFQCVDVYHHYQTVRRAYDVKYIAIHSGLEVFAQLVRTQSFNMSACFQLIRRELLEQHQIYFEKGLLSEDIDWSLRLWKYVQRVRAINLPMYGYQHREGSISTTYTIRNLRSYKHIFAKFVQLYKERVVEAAAELYWQTVMGYLAQMYTSCLYAYGQIASKDKSEAYAILKRYATLLEHSISIKSERVVLLKRYIGLRLTVGVFALYGKIRKLLKK